MSKLHLQLLGAPKISWKDGSPPRFRSQRTVALLGYLVAEQRAVSRDFLAALFWPDEPLAKGKANLRRELHNLAQILPGCWQTSRKEVTFEPDEGTVVDITQFRQYATAQQWQAAAALIGGAFLEGIVLADNLEFESWLLGEQERWRQRIEFVLNQLIEKHSRNAQYNAALGYARQLLQITPWHEETHRQIMLLLAWSGQRSAALKQFEDCRQILVTTLAVEPTEETLELYKRINAGNLSDSDAETPVIQPPFLIKKPVSATPTTPFVARKQQLDKLDHFLELALAGQGQVAFITGEAGSGKTALVQQFARRAVAKHTALVVASGQCNVFGGVGDPYLPFREIMDLLSGDIESRWLAGSVGLKQAERLWQLLPVTVQAIMAHGPDLLDLFVAGKPLDARTRLAVPPDTAWLSNLSTLREHQKIKRAQSNPNQQDLFKQYTRILQALASKHPLVLILDDLQWADPGSIGLFFHLGHHLKGQRLFIIGLYRPDEVAQGNHGQRHPLAPLINEFQHSFGQVEVKIDRAERAENENFMQAYLDSQPNQFSPAFKAALYGRTQGHALFTVEIMRDLEARGDIMQDEDGFWIERADLDWQRLPVRIEAAIGERIKRLSKKSQELLQIASIEGEFFTAEVVARVQKMDERTLIRQMSSVLDKQHHLLTSQDSHYLKGQRLSRYRFHHILFQQYLYQNLDEIERSYLHEAVGNNLETLYGEHTEQVAVQLARHFEIAGLNAKAVTYLRQAGRRARRLSAYQEAIAHFSQALILLERLDSTAECIQQEIELHAALGYLHQVTKGLGTPDAEKAYDQAWHLCQQVEIDDNAQAFRVQWGLWFYYAVISDYQTAYELAQRLWRLSQKSQDPTLILPGHRALGTTYFWMGRFVEAKPHWEKVFAQYQPQDHTLALFYGGTDVKLHCLALGAQTMCWLGYLDQGFKMSQESITFAQNLSHPYTLAAAYFFAAWFHVSRREKAAAQPLLEIAISISTEHDFPFWLSVGEIVRVWACAEVRQVEAMIPEMQQALASYRATGADIFRVQGLGMLAEMYGDAGLIERSLEVINEALATTIETDERYWEADLHRLKGELLCKQSGNKAAAEACFFKAIEVAQRQQAKIFELRAVISLSLLRQQQHRQNEAKQMLAEIYNWFSEGFDTPDLQKAKALLVGMEG